MQFSKSDYFLKRQEANFIRKLKIISKLLINVRVPQHLSLRRTINAIESRFSIYKHTLRERKEILKEREKVYGIFDIGTL